MAGAGSAEAGRPGFWEVLAEWFWRLILSVGVGAALIAGALAIPRTPLIGIPVLILCGYFLIGLLLPGRLAAVNRAVGKGLRGPYKAVFKPFVLRPMGALLRAGDNLLVGIGKVARVLVRLTFRVSLWLVGLVVVLGIAWVAFAGIAALPVSIAVVVGALIVAGALRNR